MTDKKEIQDSIYKKRSQYTIDGHLMDEKVLEVKGKDMDKIKKIFDERWDK